MKSVLSFFLKIANTNKRRLTGLVVYSMLCGYLIPYWPMLLEKALVHDKFAMGGLITIAALHFSFKYANELFLFPFHNYASYKLRLSAIESARFQKISSIKPGGIIARLSRSVSGKYILKNLANCLKYIFTITHTIFIILKQDYKLAIMSTFILIIYLVLIYSTQKYYKKLRVKAWDSTETAGEISAKALDQTLAIRQNLIEDTQARNAIKEEFSAWHNYYFKSNILFALLSLCSVMIITCVLFTTSLTTALLIWNMANTVKLFTDDIKTIIGTSVDIEIFLEKQHHEKQHDEFSLHKILLDNVFVHHLGPFNFNIQEKFTALVGQNGVGKTQLALAIANLIPYKGKISTPKAVYISLKDNHTLNTHTASMGENAIKIIEKAIKNPARLIIIDELLDILSSDNLAHMIARLKDSGKMILVITHQENITKQASEVVEIKQR